jgi:hypothetical protein
LKTESRLCKRRRSAQSRVGISLFEPVESVQMRALFYEKRIQSLDKVMEEIRRLDSDSGVRLVGLYRRKPSFAFLTRSGGTYTLMVYERKGRNQPVLGARLLSRESDSLDELRRFLAEFAEKRVDAYIY